MVTSYKNNKADILSENKNQAILKNIIIFGALLNLNIH